MIKDTLSKIKQQITSSQELTADKKEKLIELIEGLGSEISELSKTDKSGAESITNFAGTITHEATRDKKNKKLVDVSIEGFKASVTEFESSHPQLSETVAAISEMLSSIGI